MTEYELTEEAKEDLDYECEECGETEYPTVVDVEEPEIPLVDYQPTLECVSCGRETKANLWERDIKKK